jgi:uncharacterized membrane protein
MDTTMKGFKEIQTVLKFTYAIVPIVAGLDKFTNLLADWPSYINPFVLSILPVSGHTFMMIVGVIEIIAGILVFVKTYKGALLVSAWLVLIALNLITSGKYLDVAVRDLVMAVGAFMLAKMTRLLSIE